MRSHERKAANSPGKWIALAIFLLISDPVLLVPLAIFGSIYWLVRQSMNKPPKSPARTATRYTTRQDSFDDCPQPFFCRHKDKAEHHVRRGKEVDPWDRPDIDISKYQRNR